MSDNTPPVEPDSVGKRLRLFLAMNRITSREFGEMCGIPYRTVRQYFNETTKPGTDHLARMAAAGVDIEWLVTGKSAALLSFELGGASFPPVSGIVGADKDLAHELMIEAIYLVDEMVLDRPELVTKLGVFGIVASIWSTFSTYAELAQKFADRFEKARLLGWDIAQLAAIITEPLRETMRERLNKAADQVAAGDAIPARTVTITRTDRPVPRDSDQE